MKVWQEIMLDLLGRRDEAIMCYKDALKNSDGRSDNCFPSAFLIDKKWLETNIKSPFAWGESK